MVKCSECWKVEVRPVVAIDLDGTIGDYHGSLFRFAAQWFGVDGSVWESTFHGQCRLSEHMGVSDDEYRRMKLAYRQGGMKRTMPMFGGAQAVLTDLRRKGAEVWITTTRPYNKFDSTDPDTREWLRRNNVEFDGLIFDDDKYRVLASVVDPGRIISVVDDLPSNCIRAGELGLPATMLLNRYNMMAAAEYDGKKCVSMHDLSGHLCQGIDEWRRKYGS